MIGLFDHLERQRLSLLDSLLAPLGEEDISVGSHLGSVGSIGSKEKVTPLA